MKPIYIILIVLISVYLLYLLVSYLIFKKIFVRMNQEVLLTEVENLEETEYKPYVEMIRENIPKFMSIPYEEIYIEAMDHLKLHAKYYNQNSDTTILFFHGYHADPINSINTIGLSILDRGYNLLLVTERSHGKSGGKYITLGVKEQEDVKSWVYYMKDTYSPKHMILWGASMGCASIEMASKDSLPRVDGMILDCGFTGSKEMLKFSLKRYFHFVPYLMYFHLCCLSSLFGFRLQHKEAKKALEKTRIPAFFVHGTNDKLVPYFMGEENYQACASPKKRLVTEAGHVQSFYQAKEEYEREAFQFITDCIKK